MKRPTPCKDGCGQLTGNPSGYVTGHKMFRRRNFPTKVERAAQRIYDLRDECPYLASKAWMELDRIATRLSKIAARLAKEERT